MIKFILLVNTWHVFYLSLCLWHTVTTVGLSLISLSVDILIRPRDRAWGRCYTLLLYSLIQSSCGKGWTPLHFPPYSSIPEEPLSAAKFLSLSLFPSPSLQLNGGKGYKVSPQRPIQSTVYSGNLTPAAVSAPGSDHYRVVREKGNREKWLQGVLGMRGCL